MTKFKLLIILAALLLSVSAFGQVFSQQGVYTGVTVPGGQGTMLQNSQINYHVLAWTVSGTVSTCTIKLQTSTDGASFSDAGTTQTCTSTGSYALSGTNAKFMRFNIATFSATGTLTVTYQGYFNNPATQGLTTTGGYIVLPPQVCSFSTTGTAGTGANTIIVDGSFQALKGVSTSASSSHNIFTCTLAVPSSLTSGKGVIIQDVVLLYSQQGSATGLSEIAPVCNSFTAPAAGASESASSATPVACGGALTATPVIGSANLTAVSAGQYYSQKVAFGTPISLNTDLVTNQIVLEFDQSGSTATLITVSGLVVHYNTVT